MHPASGVYCKTIYYLNLHPHYHNHHHYHIIIIIRPCRKTKYTISSQISCDTAGCRFYRCHVQQKLSNFKSLLTSVILYQFRPEIAFEKAFIIENSRRASHLECSHFFFSIMVFLLFFIFRSIS